MAVPTTNMKISDITSALSITNTNVKVTDLFLSPNIIGSGLDPTYCSGADGYARLANLRDIANLGGVREFRIGKFRNYNPVTVNYKQGHLYTIFNCNYDYDDELKSVHVPNGWHIATADDVYNIINFIDGGNWTSNSAAIHLKSTYITGDTPFTPSPAWASPSVGYDTYGFKQMASGRCSRDYNTEGEFFITNIGITSQLWLLYEGSSLIAQFSKNSNMVTQISDPFTKFFELCQIRLVKDDSVNTGSVIDIEGNVYKTIKIGDTVITAEGIRTTKTKMGVSIPQLLFETVYHIDDFDNGGYIPLTTTDIP